MSRTTLTAIRALSALIALGIAVGAFVLSYENLAATATAAFGHPYNLVWPVILDGFILAGSVDVLRCTLETRTTRFAWAVTGTAVAASVAFNVAHAPHTLLGVAEVALPPLAQALSWEFLMRGLRRAPQELSTPVDSADTPRIVPPEPVWTVQPTSAPAATPDRVAKASRPATDTTGDKADTVRDHISRWTREGRDPFARGAATRIAAEAGCSDRYVRDILKTLTPA